MQSWQIYSYAKELLPKAFLQRLYTRSYPLIMLWKANPATNERHARNPIDRIAEMLRELKMAGRDDIARAAIDIMAAPLGGHFAFNDETKSDKGTIDGEATDITIAFGTLIKHCREFLENDDLYDAREAEIILDNIRLVKDELNQLYDVVKKKTGKALIRGFRKG